MSSQFGCIFLSFDFFQFRASPASSICHKRGKNIDDTPFDRPETLISFPPPIYFSFNWWLADKMLKKSAFFPHNFIAHQN